MIVRPAVLADSDAISGLLKWQRVNTIDLTTPFSGIVWVAEESGEVVGCIQCLPGNPVSVITTGAVAPGWERRGIARQLIDAVETLLQSLGLTYWMGFVRLDNDKSAGMLAKHGAEDCGLVRIFERSLE